MLLKYLYFLVILDLILIAYHTFLHSDQLQFHPLVTYEGYSILSNNAN